MHIQGERHPFLKKKKTHKWNHTLHLAFFHITIDQEVFSYRVWIYPVLSVSICTYLCDPNLERIGRVSGRGPHSLSS